MMKHSLLKAKVEEKVEAEISQKEKARDEENSIQPLSVQMILIQQSWYGHLFQERLLPKDQDELTIVHCGHRHSTTGFIVMKPKESSQKEEILRVSKSTWQIMHFLSLCHQPKEPRIIRSDKESKLRIQKRKE